MPNASFNLTSLTAILAVLLSLEAPACFGQGNPDSTEPRADISTPGEAAEERIRFRSLEIYEQKDALAGVLRRMAAERDARREQARTFESLAALANSVPKKNTDEERIVACIELQRGLQDLKRGLRESYLSCLSVLDSIQQQAVSPSLSADGARLLRESQRELRALMAQQQKDSSKLRRLDAHLQRLVKAIPPPKRFVSRMGISMVLVGDRTARFYVSESPISREKYRGFLQASAAADVTAAWEAHVAGQNEEGHATFVTWGGAKRFCGWLSAQEQHPYTLLKQTQCAMLQGRNVQLPVAAWLDEVWIPRDYVLRRELRRFAVDFAGVWDPAGKLESDTHLFGELPFARYETLGFYVVTDADTGLRERWRRVEAALR